MKLRVKFTKKGYLKYISHLDMMRMFQRTFRRGNIPIMYSQGFNPQPKISIANPLALGIESEEEYMDIDLSSEISEADFINIMNDELPEGIRVLDAKYIEDKRVVSSIVGWSYYEIRVQVYSTEKISLLQSLINEWLSNEEIMFERTKYKKGKEVRDIRNIRPLIGNVQVIKDDRKIEKEKEYILKLRILLKSGDKGNLKPMDFLKSLDEHIGLGMEVEMSDIKRLHMYTDIDGKIESPM